NKKKMTRKRQELASEEKSGSVAVPEPPAPPREMAQVPDDDEEIRRNEVISKALNERLNSRETLEELKTVLRPDNVKEALVLEMLELKRLQDQLERQPAGGNSQINKILSGWRCARDTAIA